MNKYQQQLLDSYEAEIVEDIPERFDLSRYKNTSVQHQPNRTATFASQIQLQHHQATHSQMITPSRMPIFSTQNYPYHANQQRIVLDQSSVDGYPQNHLMNKTNKTLSTFSQPAYINQYTSSLSDYPVVANGNYTNIEVGTQRQLANFQSASSQVMLNPTHQLQQQQAQLVSYSTLPLLSKKNQEAIPNTLSSPSSVNTSSAFSQQTLERKKDQKPNKNVKDSSHQQQSNLQNAYDEENALPYNWSTLPTHKALSSCKNNSSSGSSSESDATRKKSSYPQDLQEITKDQYDRYDDERQHEYYSKGSNALPRRSSEEQDYLNTRKRSSSRDYLDVHYTTSESRTISTPSINIQPTKSNLKSTAKKPGVTFDEKLEVYEVKNPHYGLDVKSEKRELRKKKKDKQKEEELIQKLKYEMKAKVQNQNMIHYYFYEKNIVFNALLFYEENYYRKSIVKLQEKLRSNKPDEKLRDQLLQNIERDNQLTIDLIKYVKREFQSQLEPYCTQYQIGIEKLHTIPGMYQIMQAAANRINVSEIINYFIQKETSSPSALRKILGGGAGRDNDSKSIEKLLVQPSSMQRKTDAWLPKNVLSAIDLHLRDICYPNYKSLIEFIYRVNEICENDLQTVRAIYKFVILTQLETLRRNETGILLMRNFDLAIESANTIFSRLCSFVGIECRFVKGLWKTICQEPGDKVESKCIWNVVNLASVGAGWRFIQPAFTPAKFLSRVDILYEESEFYFLSDPELLYFEFLPTDKLWQLNEQLLSIKEFEKRPIVTPFFRVLNLTVLNQNQFLCSHNLDKGPFKLEIRFPSEQAELINFNYTLRRTDSASSKLDLLNNNINTYVIAEYNLDHNIISFKISALPEHGMYNFTIYANSTSDDYSRHQSPNAHAQISLQQQLNDDYKAILSYRIQCPKGTTFEVPPNRITNEINVFGMNYIMKKIGLICLDFKQGIIGTDREGRVNLVFEMLQPLDVEAYLYSSDQSISPKCLELCMLKRVVHNFLIIIIIPPHAGLYGLDLYAAPKGSHSNSNLISIGHSFQSTLPPIGKFLVKSHYQVRSFYQFPKGDNREWGPKQRFYDLGMHSIGNTDPYIVNEDGKQIEIEIAMLKSVTLWFKFDYDQNGTPKPIDNYCFMNYKNTHRYKDKTASFLLRFPYRGFYHLAIMATDDVFPSKPEEIVYNYLIRVQDPSNEVESFPIILNPILWKDCCLIAPKNFRLSSYDVHFSLIISKTTQVQVTTGERVLDNLEAKEIENSWVGMVTLSENSRFLYVEAEYENKFKKLLRFKGLGYSLKD